jgi:hypothetical protein
MRAPVLALAMLLAPATLTAQVNTTGSLSPNTAPTPVQFPAPTTPAPTAPPTTLAPAAPGEPATLPAARDAAIVVCAEDFSTGAPRLVVTSATMSGGGTTPPPGAPCAQALSDLFVAGFSVLDVLPMTQRLHYTLMR